MKFTIGRNEYVVIDNGWNCGDGWWIVFEYWNSDKLTAIHGIEVG
jgi:hypothetical protein